MSEPWKPTDTVLSIIRQMRETQDFDALPILADAMQDADYPDEDVPALFRGDLITPVQRDRLLCLVMGGEYADSVKWMDEFVIEMNTDDYYGKRNGKLTYYDVMSAAQRRLDNGDWVTGYGMHWQDTFDDNRNEFWSHYEVITGRPVEDKDQDLYSCTC